MTTALVTTCDRCGKQLASKPAPKPKSASIQIIGYTTGTGEPPPAKPYDFCGQCYAGFDRWLEIEKAL